MVWLSRVVLGARSTPGKQWIGKHRKQLKDTATMRRTAEKRKQEIIMVERQLSRPYLSTQQELRHSVARRRKYVPKFVREMRQRWMRKQQQTFQEIQRTP